ncbi:FAD-dependent pyridine nucleotide-disulfide oxidoreductase [Cellulomonas flavigena DSM 20109]|uniref:FAD-dependent pyridine nucleotide-disulfide oxidoreductase n=1 Tax=Cellulomonas flavigena (strain ATCC 482 / DSM 20109 / BCRC 11376 / JCM 18109 / NBRC 3775 / NCIMB 8073 / NRS 134) TaxID=446466 RepID=D5UCY4_CELFN|nr:FAD-dependent oxidoreductase [Cellulomonas flavigena]ADG76369.1 FAD-dependent pyridine nucleotide-disulfide oxidoreductase [Cellulomonas flavigena DSM 20109]
MPTPRHRVLIVGGGNAGISLAAKLLRGGCPDVALVEPKDTHHYRPLLSYVAGGAATLDDLTRPQADVVPRGVHLYADRVTSVDPHSAVVHLAGGEKVAYGDLVLCPGSEVDWDAVPGLAEAMATPHASTSYLPEHAPDAWRMLSGLTAGRAVFAISDRHVPCSPVGLKPLFLAADHWRAAGVLDDLTVDLLVEGPRLAGTADADRELRAAAEGYGVRILPGTALTSVDAPDRTVRVRTPEGTTTIHYDALFVAPPHRAPAWVMAGGLDGEGTDGFVDVDPLTLQHRRFPRVWALGDVATVDTSPSGGALRKQVPVVAHNIPAALVGKPLRHYDGYTVAPVTTSRSELLLAEHARDGHPEPTIPFPDLGRPRRSLYWFDRHLEPQVYWHRLLRGKVS